MGKRERTPQIPLIEINEIGKIMDAARERHGLSSDEKLAALLGLSDLTIYRWRRGEIGLGARVIATLLRDQSSTAT
jgi:transcriptional regulator with XRE-family HTH domain